MEAPVETINAVGQTVRIVNGDTQVGQAASESFKMYTGSTTIDWVGNAKRAFDEMTLPKIISADYRVID